MKKLILLFLYLISISAGAKTYCDWNKVGYEEDWCYKYQNRIKPITPICPIPHHNFNTYGYGKRDGFEQGRKDRNS